MNELKKARERKERQESQKIKEEGVKRLAIEGLVLAPFDVFLQIIENIPCKLLEEPCAYLKATNQSLFEEIETKSKVIEKRLAIEDDMDNKTKELVMEVTILSHKALDLSYKTSYLEHRIKFAPKEDNNGIVN